MSETLVATEKREKTIEEIGLEKGYLKNMEVFLIPIPGKRLTMTTKETNSAHAFMYEGAEVDFCLPQNERLDLLNPFDSMEERQYFEKVLGRDLNHSNARYDEKCFWNSNNFNVSISVTAEIKSRGYRLNMMDPTDVLRFKILKLQYDVAPDMESVDNPATQKPHWKWVLKSSEYRDTSKAKAGESKIKAYKAFAKMEDHTEKMIEFLNLYYANNKIAMIVSDNTSTTALKSMIEDIITTNIESFTSMTEDPDFEIKSMIMKAVKSGAIEKHGVNSYSYPGGFKYSFNEFVDHVKLTKESQDEDYLKLLAHMEMKKKVVTSKS